MKNTDILLYAGIAAGAFFIYRGIKKTEEDITGILDPISTVTSGITSGITDIQNPINKLWDQSIPGAALNGFEKLTDLGGDVLDSVKNTATNAYNWVTGNTDTKSDKINQIKMAAVGSALKTRFPSINLIGGYSGNYAQKNTSQPTYSLLSNAPIKVQPTKAQPTKAETRKSSSKRETYLKPSGLSSSASAKVTTAAKSFETATTKADKRAAINAAWRAAGLS